MTIPEKDLQKFADLMVKKIEEIEEYPGNPWFSPRGKGLPQNLQERIYHGINSFILSLLCDVKNYKTPVFMTFLQAKQENLRIKKGECAFPVIYWNFTYKDSDGKKISKEQFSLLSQEEKEKCTTRPYAKIYLVFNVEQTDYPEVFPNKWKDLQHKFSVPELKDEKGMLSCPHLDKMIEEKKWLCPIMSEYSDSAYYIPSKDEIHLPLKGQFNTGEDYYNTLLHEMGHSTGNSNRLNREGGEKFGDKKYGREELVAEMTAAVSCQSLGLPARLQEENAAYLKSWLGAIKEEPMFLFSVLSDVGKASNMILEEVNKINLEHTTAKSNDITEKHLPEIPTKDNTLIEEREKDKSFNFQSVNSANPASAQLTINF